jgi:hypothetical protein
MILQQIILRKIRIWISIFMLLLVLSGVTAFPVRTELSWICTWWPEHSSGFYHWLQKCSDALNHTENNYPFLLYGYDWLAFSHIVIAVFFLGIMKDPVRNKWILQAGLIACVMVFPLAFIAGYFRGIPIGWQLVDCSFGLLGLIPLLICIKYTSILENNSLQSFKSIK